MQLTGDASNVATGNLRAALSKGSPSGFHASVRRARTDPNLADVRRLRGEALTDLTKVKYTWDIDWGILNDDVMLTNGSAFPITDVVLCRVGRQGLDADAQGPADRTRRDLPLAGRDVGPRQPVRQGGRFSPLLGELAGVADGVRLPVRWELSPRCNGPLRNLKGYRTASGYSCYVAW